MRSALARTFLVSLLPSLLPAQQGGASLSAGAVSVRYAGAQTTTAVTLAPTFTVAAPTAVIAFAGSLAQLQGSGLSPQGTLAVSTFSHAERSNVLGEVGFALGGSAHPDGASTGQGSLNARLHVLRTHTSAWVGVGLGRMWAASDWSGLREGEFGVSWRGELSSWQARVVPTRALDSLRYTDVHASAVFPLGAVDWSLSLGGRTGESLPIAGADARVWGGVSASWWLSSRSALVAAAGSYPVDLTQGFPAGRYLSLAVRVGGSRQVSASDAAAARDARRESRAAGVEGFSLVREADGRMLMRVHAPKASRVELLGDPTGWVAVALEQGRDGWWSTRIDARGVVEIALRVDGGEWLVPPGAELVTDEFGGRVGRVTLPDHSSGTSR